MLRRNVPLGLSRNALTRLDRLVDAVEDRLRIANNRSPASVSATLRVVRLRRRTPSLSSKERIVWLRLGRDIPSWAAALVKFRCSATATKALSSAN